MKTIDSIPDEFFKPFKTGEERSSFFRALQKRTVEKMRKGELDTHLRYKKHDSPKETHTRNGYSSETIKTSYGEDDIQVPRDRAASFNQYAYP